MLGMQEQFPVHLALSRLVDAASALSTLQLLRSYVKDYIFFSLLDIGLKAMVKKSQSNSRIDDGSHSEIVQLLTQVAVLSVLTDEERKQLAAKVRSVAYRAGEFIVRQGESGNSLFIIHGGGCEVFISDQQGYIEKVAQTKRGDFFGEMSLLTGKPHTATVRAMEDTTLVSIDKAVFASILQANPQISKELGRVLAIRQKNLAALAGSPVDDAQSSTSMIARIKSFFRIE